MASNFLSLKDNSGPLAADIAAIGADLSGVGSADAAAAFRDIRDILTAGIRTNLSGAFTPLAKATLEYKARMGMDSRALHASGATAANINGKSGGTWARAQRGQAEWYIFLHDRGKGYSYWSVDGRKGWSRWGDSRSSKRRRQRNQPGTTQFPQRRAFVVSPETESAVLGRYRRLLETVLDKVGK